MKKSGSKNFRIANAAMIAAIYTVLTLLQNFILPGTTNLAVQFRISEALNVLAIFTPAAIYGLTTGCVLSNLICGSSMPVDIIIGSLATALSTICMYLCRKIRIKKYPLLSMIFPVIFNGIAVGWEIEYLFVEGPFEWVGFLTNCGMVAIGEAAVMFTAGTALFTVLRKKSVSKNLNLR